MNHYGIQWLINNWITHWLSDRTHTVDLMGVRLYTAWVRSGIPQGSVLGHCLFLFYINDINANVKSNVRLFADYGPNLLWTSKTTLTPTYQASKVIYIN